MATKRKRKDITQAEARALKRRVAELEDAEERRRTVWVSNYPGGVNIGTCDFASSDSPIPTAMKTARRLGHAVVAVDDGHRIRFYALPLPKA